MIIEFDKSITKCLYNKSKWDTIHTICDIFENDTTSWVDYYHEPYIAIYNNIIKITTPSLGMFLLEELFFHISSRFGAKYPTRLTFP